MSKLPEGIFDRRYRALTVGAILAVSIVAFEALALTTVAPTIAGDLDSVGLYGWIFSAFLLAQIVGAVAAGQQADRRGPAKPFIVSLSLLGAGLLVGALAPNMTILVCGRFLQGLGGGALVTCVYAIISTAYPDELRTRMLAAFSSAFVLPALIGPAIAGFVADQYTWRAVFWGLLPFVAVVGLLTTPAFGRLSPSETNTANGASTRSRLPGAILLAAGTGLLLAGLKIATDDDLSLAGWEMHPTIAGLPLAVVGLATVIPALRSVLPTGTLAFRRGLPATVAAKGLLAAGYFYTEVYLVLALKSLAGYGATTSGLVVSAGALSWTVGTWTQERLDRRREGAGRRGRVLFGTALMAAGISTLAAVIILSNDITLPIAVATWITAGLGMGLANTGSLAIAFAQAPGGEEGKVSSSVLLSELFFPATSIGLGGVLVALGSAYETQAHLGIVLAFGLSFLLVALLLASAYRLPGDTAVTNSSRS